MRRRFEPRPKPFFVKPGLFTKLKWFAGWGFKIPNLWVQFKRWLKWRLE